MKPKMKLTNLETGEDAPDEENIERFFDKNIETQTATLLQRGSGATMYAVPARHFDQRVQTAMLHAGVDSVAVCVYLVPMTQDQMEVVEIMGDAINRMGAAGGASKPKMEGYVEEHDGGDPRIKEKLHAALAGRASKPKRHGLVSAVKQVLEAMRRLRHGRDQ